MNKMSIDCRRSKVHDMVLVAMMASVTCILSPMVIPIGPVPISFLNLIIYFSIYLLRWKMATVSYLVYLGIGLVGLPVFSGYSGGIGKLLGPTGGYLIGFILTAIIAGMIVDKYSSRLIHGIGMIVGTIVSYVLGTAWFCIIMDSSSAAALGMCVFPFIPGDIIKIVIAVMFGPALRERLRKEGFYGAE